MARAVTIGGHVEVQGLRDFALALKKLDAEYPKALKDANQDLAREIVKRAKALANTEGGVARKASKSLRAARMADSAVVTGGGARSPEFFGAEFGGKARFGWYERARYVNSEPRQFKPWRGNQWQGWDGGPGYFLHPVIRRDARTLIDQYLKRLDELHSRAFS